MSRKVADVLWEMLANAGVKRCYGIVGDALNPVIDGCGKLPISPFVFGLHSSAKSPASLRSTMIYKGSARDPYVRFVRAPPSNGIGLIRSFCARSIAAFTTILALFKNLGCEEKYCLSWQSSSSGSAHAPAYQ